MALLILMPDRDNSDLAEALYQKNNDLDIRTWPDCGPVEDIEYAIVWNHPAGSLLQFPNLKVIASYGAGVDHILNDTNLPKNVTITRLVDDALAHQLAKYVAGAILNHRLRLTEYREYQAACSWSPKENRPGNTVCLLGLGNIGQEVAEYLTMMEFVVKGWSQSPKKIKDVSTFHGPQNRDKALKDADYIVCLLPLTSDTENILNRDLFMASKNGAYLINAGRGAHLNEDDLMDAIYQEKITGACLDVFRTEPLPVDHPFWRHPKISITPHIASLTNLEKAVTQLYDNYMNMRNTQPLFNPVDPVKGY